MVLLPALYRPSSPRPEWDAGCSEDASALLHIFWNTDFASGSRNGYRITVQRDKIGRREWKHAIACDIPHTWEIRSVISGWSRAGEFRTGAAGAQIPGTLTSKIRTPPAIPSSFTRAVHVVPGTIQKAYDEYCESDGENPERCDGFCITHWQYRQCLDISRDNLQKTGETHRSRVTDGWGLDWGCLSFCPRGLQQFDTASYRGLAYCAGRGYEICCWWF